ncbi:hypothetical protein PV326_006262, partial [Microctonus aethiopoides]
LHTPLRYAPHLSTISESPLSTYRRYTPAVLPSCRPRRIIDTADIDVSTPRLLQSNHSHQGNRLRRDRPTIRIRSQALKDNPALRDHIERREKTVGELLVEKFLIKDKKLTPEDIKMKMYKQMNLQSITPSNEQHEAIQKRVTRRMTRRRSSADITMDPEQIQRQLAMAQVQAKVLDNLVAEEQAEIEVETRNGTLIHKNIVRGTSGILKKTDSSESDNEDDNVIDSKRKLLKKIKKRKKTTDKPSPPCHDITLSDNKIKGKLIKVEASNSVDDLSKFLLNSNEQKNLLEQYRESIKLPAPKSFIKTPELEEEIVILPVKKPYVCDNTRNSVYLTLKTQIGKLDVDNELENDTSDIEAYRSTANDDGRIKVAKIKSKDTIESDVEVKVVVDTNNSRGIDGAGNGWAKDEVIEKELIDEVSHVSDAENNSSIVSIVLPCCLNNPDENIDANVNTEKFIGELQVDICKETFVDDTDEILLRELSQVDEFKSKNLVRDDKKISLTDNSTWDFCEGEEKADRKKKRKKKTLVEKFEEGLVDINLAKSPENEKYESLPNTTTIINYQSGLIHDLTTQLPDNKFNKQSIDESNINNDFKETINDSNVLQELFVNVDDSIENNNLITVIQNASKINESVVLNNDDDDDDDNKSLKKLINLSEDKINFKESGNIESCHLIDNNVAAELCKLKNLSQSSDNICEEDIEQFDKPISNANSEVVSEILCLKDIPEVKLKNKSLIKLKGLSTDSGIGSLDVEPVIKFAEHKVKKKLLKNSKGLSFDCDDETKVKSITEKKLKIKFINSKSLPAGDENECKEKFNSTDFSDTEIIKTKNLDKKCINKTSSLESDDNFKLATKSLPILQEEFKNHETTVCDKAIKDSPEDIDFWREIKTVETTSIIKVNKSKDNLKKTFTNEILSHSTPELLPTIDDVKPDISTTELSPGLLIKKKKKIKCTEAPVEREKKEKTAEIIFDSTTLEDEKSSESLLSNKILQQLETLLEEPVRPKTFDNKENKIIMDAKINDKILSTTEKSSSQLDNISQDIKTQESSEFKSSINDSTAPIINISKSSSVPEIEINIDDNDKENDYNDDDNEDDDEPKTPTNEEDKPELINNMSKWKGSPNLTTLNDKEVASTTIETVNEVTGSTVVTPSTSGKKKLGRRKKSSTKSIESTIIRKITEERSSNSSDTTLKPGIFKTTPKVSPINPPEKNRPVDLMKMFYTTPTSLLTATPRDLSKVKRAKIKRRKHSTRTPSASSDSTGSTTSTQSTGTAESTRSNSTEVEDEAEQKRISSTRSNDSGFDGSPRLSNCDMACHKKCEKLTGNLCGLNQKLVAEALQALKRAPSQSSDNQRNSDSSDHVHGGGRITPPATNLPRFKKYLVEDFNFLKEKILD